MNADGVDLHPLAVNWMVTDHCSRRCIYCLTDSGKPMSGELNAENRLRIVEVLSSLGVRRISLMGGEPFLLPELPAITRCAYLHGLTINITTSGMGCTVDRLVPMKDSLQYLNVSLDGPETFHDRYRGQGSYRQAVEAIRTARGLGIPVRLYAVLTTENSNPSVIDWLFQTAQNLSVMLIMFIFLSPTGRGAACVHLRVPLDDRAQIYSAIQQSAQKYNVRYKACDPYQPEEFKLFVDADGSVYKHAGGGIQESLGHLLQEPDQHIWQRLSDAEQAKHWHTFHDLLPLMQIPQPAFTCPLPGMIYIPPGIFQMGSNLRDREQPVHPVYLDGFYIDCYQVTNAQFVDFLNACGNQVECGTTWLDLASPYCLIEVQDKRYHPKPGFDNYPVVAVTWYGANTYAAWVSKRLPTEAEWEKAARGGLVNKTYPWGDEPPDERCNWSGYDGPFKNLRPDFYHNRGPLPVGLYPPNRLGLYDMAGNVWEWCSDWYPRRGYSAENWINPRETIPTKHKILRGGSWSFAPSNLHVANRSYAEPSDGYSYDGFRCAISTIEILMREFQVQGPMEE